MREFLNLSVLFLLFALILISLIVITFYYRYKYNGVLFDPYVTDKHNLNGVYAIVTGLFMFFVFYFFLLHFDVYLREFPHSLSFMCHFFFLRNTIPFRKFAFETQIKPKKQNKT